MEEPKITDKRAASKIRYGELEPSTDKATTSRLSNVRWPLGEEPYADVQATDKDSPWVNLKIEQHVADNDPNQRHLLHGGAELRFKCHKCNEPLHIAAEKPILEVIEEAGMKIAANVDMDKLKAQKLIAACCINGHVTQFRGDMIERMVKRA